MEISMRHPIKKVYYHDSVSAPENKKPLKIMHKKLDEFRCKLPPSVAHDFDKIYDDIIAEYLKSYPFQLRNMNDDFALQLNTIISIVSTNKINAKISQKTKNNLELINQESIKPIRNLILNQHK